MKKVLINENAEYTRAGCYVLGAIILAVVTILFSENRLELSFGIVGACAFFAAGYEIARAIRFYKILVDVGLKLTQYVEELKDVQEENDKVREIVNRIIKNNNTEKKEND